MTAHTPPEVDSGAVTASFQPAEALEIEETGNGSSEPEKARASLRKAINAFCRGCLYDPHEPGTWRQQVHACTATDCPLYEIRPRSAAPLGEPQ